MDRNRWETALRCLEVAVHPNTSDEEVVAAVNGFRRTAGRTALTQLYAADAPGHLLSRLDQLNRANLALRRKLEEAEVGRAAALKSLQQAEERTRRVGEELLDVEHRAAIAEQQLTEIRGAYGRLSSGLRGENDDLRRSLDEARRNMAQPIHEPVRPFQTALNAALQRSEPAAVVAPMAGRLGSA
jgi:chromosome segregation ATPase